MAEDSDVADGVFNALGDDSLATVELLSVLEHLPTENARFDKEALAIAYDRTCVNTGGMSWAYMNRILTRWHEAGLLTAQQVEKGDQKSAVPKGASGVLGEAELEAIRQILQEG